MKESTVAALDAKAVRIVDLSIVGAQVVSSTGLKPNQTVTLTLNDEAGTVRFSATVVWTSFEIPPGSGARYRAGINFTDADPVDVDGFCSRHRS